MTSKVTQEVIQAQTKPITLENTHREWLDALLNEYSVSQITGMSVATVRRWRLLQQGPRYIKIGAAVRYKPEDLRSWLESRPTGGECLSKSHGHA
jgi:predicted DNA-binding transcriptional regulator AlpA